VNDKTDYIKEYFFRALDAQTQSAADTEKHKWQLRLGWAIFSATFLGACVTSQDFRCLQFSYWWSPLLGNLLLGFVFFLYDCHLTHVTGSVNQRAKKIRQRLAQMPTELPFDLFFQDPRKEYNDLPFRLIPWRGHRPWVKFGAAKSLDFLLFYLFTTSFWIVGWLIKFGKF